MPRANRFYVPNAVWHITHRCHDRQFLLKALCDRLRWKHWLFQARKRYGLVVLNYMATSNHIHLLILEDQPGSIARGMQLIAGRTAQEYNQRKKRRGAFWEDRYFATAIATDNHLIKCLVYIDLNMVRARAVDHPAQWKVCGFNEIQSPPQRYRIIDMTRLGQLTGVEDVRTFQSRHRRWIEDTMRSGITERQSHWTESVAIGSEEYLAHFKNELGSRALYRTVSKSIDNTFSIKDSAFS